MLKQFFSSRTQSFKQITALTAILIVAIVGTILLTGSHASTPYISLNADKGTLANGATSQTCNGASDGNCVKFGGTSKVSCTSTLTTASNVGSVVNSASPGAVICLSPGTYTQSPSISRAGTATSPITLTSADPANPATMFGRFVTGGSTKYLNINHLKFLWQPGQVADAVVMSGDHINFTNNDVSGNGLEICLNLVAWNGVSFTNSLVDHNILHNCENDNIHNQGIYISDGTNNVISNNWCYAVSARCYQIRGGSNNTWHNNVADDDNWGWIFGDLAPTNNNVYNNIVGPDVRNEGSGPYSAGGSVITGLTGGGSGNSFHDSCIPSVPYQETGTISLSNNLIVKVQFADVANHNYNLSSASVNDPCRAYAVQGGNPGP